MYSCHPLQQRCMRAAPRVAGEGGGRREAGLGGGGGGGEGAEESPRAEDVTEEAETVLGLCTRVLKTFYLEVGTV